MNAKANVDIYAASKRAEQLRRARRRSAQNLPLRVAGLVALFSVLNLLRVLASLS